MSRLPAFPSFDFSDLDLSRVRMPEIRFPDVKLPAMELPQVRMPKVDVPDVTLPDVTLPDVDTDRVLGFARDAAYVGIGLTVLAIQQSQVRRREAQRRISDGVDALRRAVA